MSTRLDGLGFEVTSADSRQPRSLCSPSFVSGDVREADVTRLPFEDGAFDGAVLGEVLEHVEDDRQALRELARVLRPGGVLALSVPADPALYGPSDEWAGHARRYTRDGLMTVCREAGFTVQRCFGWVFPALALYLATSMTVPRPARASRPVDGTGPSSPSSARSSKSTGSSSASSEGRWATSFSQRVRSPTTAVWAGMAAFAAVFGALAALEHRAFETGRFDLGNMTQAVWSTAHGRPLEVTELAASMISRLGAHVDSILVLFAPLWWICRARRCSRCPVSGCRARAPRFRLGRKHLGSEWRVPSARSPTWRIRRPMAGARRVFTPLRLACPLLLFAFLVPGRDGSGRSCPSRCSRTDEGEIPLVVGALGDLVRSPRRAATCRCRHRRYRNRGHRHLACGV